MYSPVIVFTFTTPTILSDEGQVSMIRTRGLFPLGKFSSFKSTMVPGSIFVWCTFHLRLDCKGGRYLICHLFQNWLDIATTCFHFLQFDMSPLFYSITAPLLYLPNSRWFGVSRSRSFGLSSIESLSELWFWSCWIWLFWLFSLFFPIFLPYAKLRVDWNTKWFIR